MCTEQSAKQRYMVLRNCEWNECEMTRTRRRLVRKENDTKFAAWLRCDGYCTSAWSNYRPPGHMWPADRIFKAR